MGGHGQPDCPITPAMCSPSRNERDHDVGVPIEVLMPAVVDGRGARISIPRDDLGVSGAQSRGRHLGGLVGPRNGSMVERLRGDRKAGLPAGVSVFLQEGVRTRGT